MSALATMPCMAKREYSKKEAIAARVDPELIAWLEARAVEEDRSLSYMVEKAIKLMREADSKPRPPQRR